MLKTRLEGKERDECDEFYLRLVGEEEKGGENSKVWLVLGTKGVVMRSSKCLRCSRLRIGGLL